MALKLSGNVMSFDSEVFDYQNRKTGQKEKLHRIVIILQGDYGILVGLVFNPKADMSTVKVGQKLSVELREYKNEGGIQKAVFLM